MAIRIDWQSFRAERGFLATRMDSLPFQHIYTYTYTYTHINTHAVILDTHVNFRRLILTNTHKNLLDGS